MSKEPISSNLFDIIIEYSQKATAKKVPVENSLRRTSPLLTFCQNFYAQFFQNVLRHEITSIDPRAKRDAVRIRRELKRAGEAEQTIRVITWFEKLCDIYPDILALGYASRGYGFHDFHQSYMIPLLERILAWAEAKSLSSMERRTRIALAAFRKATGDLLT